MLLQNMAQMYVMAYTTLLESVFKSFDCLLVLRLMDNEWLS